jgi:hypothetical protein
MEDGFIERESGLLQIKGDSFASFLRNVDPKMIKNWEREGVGTRVTSLRTTFVVGVIAAGAFLIYSQADILNSWVTYLTALTTLIPVCLRLLEMVRGGGKD